MIKNKQRLLRFFYTGLIFLNMSGAVNAEVIGDVNNDGKIGLVEVIYALRVAADLYPPGNEVGDRGDVNNDGKIDLVDAVHALKVVNGQSPPVMKFVKTMHEMDWDDDGVAEERAIFTYDAGGNLIMAEWDGDTSEDEYADGVIDSQRTYTYDANDNLATEETDLNVNGVVDVLITYTYDADGNIIIKDQQGITSPSLSKRFLYTYDANGKMTLEQKDNEPDDVIDSQTFYTYDADGNLAIKGFDSNADDVVTALNTYAYDANGNRTGYEYSIGDNQVQSIHSYTYDADGNLILYEIHAGPDGQALEGLLIEARAYAYDVYGNMTLSEWDVDGNGVFDERTTYTWEQFGLINGVAVKGIIVGGVVRAYAVNDDGSKGAELGSDQTDENGRYSIDVSSHKGPIIVEVTGGTYLDEATGLIVDNNKLRVVIPPVGVKKKVAITPLTEMAVLIAGEALTLTRINNANAAVAVLMGGVDIIKIQPPDINGDLNDATDEEKDYAMLLAVISQMVEDGSAVDVADAVAKISADLADDGELTLEMGILETPAGIGDLLRRALDNFIASPENNAGLAMEDINLDEALGDAAAAPYFFSGFDGVNGIELWVSDGTEAGTKMLKDINPGIGDSFPQDLHILQGTLIFWADDGTHGIELWVSDGTEEGTFMVKDMNPGAGDGMPYNMVVVGNKIYCRAKDGTHGFELWVSDGTEEGTYMVKDINPGSGGSVPMYLTEMDGKVYFHADDGTNGAELWVTDGTEAGTYMVKDICVGADSGAPMQFAVMDGKLYFSARSGTNDIELWVSDGTEAGTQRVKDINPGTGYSIPSSMTLFRGKLYFEADDGTHGYELWTSNGTEAGTYMVKDIRVGESNGISRLGSRYTEMGGKLYFTATPEGNGDLWVTDGTEAGTYMVSSVSPSPSTYDSWGEFTNMGGKLYFSGSEAAHGSELWTSDGTEAGTYMVKDIVEGADHSLPWDIVNMGGKVYFSTLYSPNGTELWVSDGTEAGTYMVKDINPGADQGYYGSEDDPLETVPPTTPTDFIASVNGATQVDLSWTASTDNVLVDGYKVYSSGTLLTTVYPGTTYSHTGLDAETQYCYTVSAVDLPGNESDQSAEVCATTEALP